MSRIEGTPWRVVVHWHDGGGRELVPAGIEVRCYAVEDDNEHDFWGGQERPNHEVPILDEGERSRPVSSGLLNRRVLWGQILGEHAARFSTWLAQSADETASMHQGSADVMDKLAGQASSLTRATGDTYERVAELYKAALGGPARSRPAVYVLEQLVKDGYPLNAANKSDRVKVRSWISKARDMKLLPPSLNQRKER